jgi:hypothetical protein
MASSKRTTNNKPGTPPSHRRSRTPIPTSPDVGFALPAAVALDIKQIQGIWKKLYKAGLMNCPWDADVCLMVWPYILQKGRIDWSGMEEVKPIVMAALEQWKAGDITLEEFQANIKPS